MVDTTEIEKKSLEAHVELCAERYKMLELKLEAVDDKIVEIHSDISSIAASVSKMAEKRNDQLIGWGIGIIGALVSTVVWLLTQYVFK
jgi:chromosome segregation ATPase